MYVVELIKPTIKLSTLLSDKNTTYNIPAIHEIVVSQLSFSMIARVIHTTITSEKNM
jgi:hypothetical protein